uniref:Putative ovule protein n=1 Tax=Solanum chacoense TaxID=4108 RepID=A0A0V0HKM4_SOLCH
MATLLKLLQVLIRANLLKTKRTTVSGQDPSHGRETSQIWNHFEKILDKKGQQKGNAIIALKYFLALVSMGLLIYGHI